MKIYHAERSLKTVMLWGWMPSAKSGMKNGTLSFLWVILLCLLCLSLLRRPRISSRAVTTLQTAFNCSMTKSTVKFYVPCRSLLSFLQMAGSLTDIPVNTNSTQNRPGKTYTAAVVWSFLPELEKPLTLLPTNTNAQNRSSMTYVTWMSSKDLISGCNTGTFFSWGRKLWHMFQVKQTLRQNITWSKRTTQSH